MAASLMPIYSQNGFLSSSHTYSISENELTIYQRADFAYGYGNTCPELISYTFQKIDSLIKLDLYYDTRGFWPQAGCSSFDTIKETFNSGIFVLIVDCNLIQIDSVISSSDTVLYDSDTTSNVILSITGQNMLSNKIKIYPNPAKDILQIEVSENIEIQEITLINLEGKPIKNQTGSFESIDVADLPVETYFIRIKTNHGVLTEKIIIQQ